MNTTSNPTLFDVPDANLRVKGRAKWWVPFLGWPLLILGYLFTPLYAVSFGLLDKRLARQYERQLAADVRSALGFLFINYQSRIVPNEGARFPPGFDGADVTVAVDKLVFRFVRGRGEFGAHVASIVAPTEWHDLSLVLCIISGQRDIQRRNFRDAWDVSRALQPHITALLELGDVQRFDELKQRLERDFYRHERVRIRQAEFALNFWLYGNKRDKRLNCGT
jgi:hypothetical protein